MSRLRHTDILCELVELGQERTLELRQKLVYYRASVYKDETATAIVVRIDQLRLLANLLADDPLQEAFKDFDAMSKAGAMSSFPGECSFSKRVSSLLVAVTASLDHLHSESVSRGVQTANDVAFTDVVRQHRDALLALCRHGSRQWAFFQAL